MIIDWVKNLEDKGLEDECLQLSTYHLTLIVLQRFCHGVNLLEKVVLQDNLSTLVVNLYPNHEGYSLMLKGKNGTGMNFFAFCIIYTSSASQKHIV